MKKSKLLLDCVLIITSVVPPELPMELSLAVNASLMALSKYGECLILYCFSYDISQSLCSLQLFSVLSPSGFHLPGVWTSAASIKRGRSLRKISFSKESLVSSTFSTPTLSLHGELRRLSSRPKDPRAMLDVKETNRETTLCLAAAHALAELDDGTIIGDPMEKTTLEALDWTVSKGMST